MKSHYEVIEIKDNIFHIRNIFEPLQAYFTLIIGTEKALLFDTGVGFEDVSEIVKELTEKPFIVVNSHGHIDHCGGNYYVPSSYLHPDDITHWEKTHKEKRINALRLAENLPANFQRDKYLAALPGKTLPLRDNIIFDLGQVCAKTVHLPGHTTGSMGLYLESIGLLLSGDCIRKEILVLFEESTCIPEYIRTLQKLKSLQIKNIIESHSASIMGVEVLDALLEVMQKVNLEQARIIKSKRFSVDEVYAYSETVKGETYSILFTPQKLQ